MHYLVWKRKRTNNNYFPDLGNMYISPLKTRINSETFLCMRTALQCVCGRHAVAGIQADVVY
jgi:hypothetical protein